MRACLLACLLFTAALALAEPRILRTSGRDSSPYHAVRNGMAVGACPDLLAALQKQLPDYQIRGIDQIMSLPMIEQALQTHQLDLGCNFGRTPQRELNNVFVAPLWRSQHILLVRHDDPVSIPSLEALVAHSREQPVIVRRSSVYAGHLKRLGIARDESSDNIHSNVRKLLNHRARFLYGDRLQLFDYLQRKQLLDQVRTVPVSIPSEQFYLIMSRQLDPQVQQAIANAIATLQQNGELAHIRRHYGLAPP